MVSDEYWNIIINQLPSKTETFLLIYSNYRMYETVYLLWDWQYPAAQPQAKSASLSWILTCCVVGCGLVVHGHGLKRYFWWGIVGQSGAPEVLNKQCVILSVYTKCSRLAATLTYPPYIECLVMHNILCIIGIINAQWWQGHPHITIPELEAAHGIWREGDGTVRVVCVFRQ